MNLSEVKKSHFKPGGYVEFLTIATPLMISHGAVSLHHFTDRLFLSWYGQNEIAASLPAGILAYTIIAFFLGISSYTNTFVAQYHGAEQPQNIGKATWQGIHFSIIAGFLSLLLIPLGHFIIYSSGHEPEVISLEITYFNYVYMGIFFYILDGALSSFYSGRGKTLIIMFVTITGTTLNVILDYAMIFGVWGFPEMGIKGAAIATVIANGVMSGMYLTMMLSKSNHKQYQTRSTYSFDKHIFNQLLKFGVPAGVQQCLSVASFTVFVFLVGSIGLVELAASNIVIAINTLSFMPALGASMAAAAMVGQYIGRKDYATAEKSAYTAIISVEALMVLFALAFILIPEPILRLFEGHSKEGVQYEEIIQYGKTLLIFVAVYQVFDAMLITFSGALRGAGDTKFAMWTELVCAWCFFVPGTWLILFVFDGGVLLAWFWASLYIAAVGLTLFTRFKLGYWKSIQVISAE